MYVILHMMGFYVLVLQPIWSIKRQRRPISKILVIASSVLFVTISAVSASVDVVRVVAHMRSACRLVLRTSKGEVKSAAVVPLTAPLANATPAPSYPSLPSLCLQAS